MQKPQIETKDDDDTAPSSTPESASFWQQQIELAEKDHKDFWDFGAKVEKRYKNERDSSAKIARGKRLNILYSNTETVKASLYTRTAKPDIRQRFTQQADKLGKTVAEMLERSLSATSECSEHDKSYRQGVQDLSLPGRGVIRVNYEPEFGVDPATGQQVITEQEVEEEFVYYRDFLHAPAQCWGHVWWISFRHKMTRDDLREAKFEDAETVPMNWSPDIEQAKDKTVSDDLKRAEVWEIWHKAKKQRLWIVKGHGKILRIDDDPYGLDEFFPMAEPIQAVCGNDSFIPRAWFTQYEDQADDLDEITNRISVLTKALRRRGVYNASIKELKRLARAADNEFIPAENFAAFATSGGLKGNFDSEDIAPIANTILALYQQKEQLLQSIYDTMGISDILRGGATNPNETATAQALKSQNGSIRMKLAQRDVQRWIKDTLQIKAELIAEHFEPQSLMAMSGMQLPTQVEVQQQMAEMQAQQQMQAMQALQAGQEPPPPQQPPEPPLTIDQVIQVLRDDKLRSYQIDIETDSTVFEDAEAEKAARTELLTSMAGFLQQWMPIAQTGGPPMIKLGFDMLAFGVRGFKAGRQLEDSLDEARMAIEESAKQAAAQPPLSPEEQKMQMDREKHDMDMESKRADLTAKKLDGPEGKNQMASSIVQTLDKFAQALTAPKVVSRDQQGRLIGIETVRLN